MKKNVHLTVDERRAQEGRVYRTALSVAVLVHVLVFAFWKTIPIPPSPFSAAGPRAGDFRAAGGGMQALNLSIPPPRVIRPPRVPVVSIDVTDPVIFDDEPQVDLSTLLGDDPGKLAAPGFGNSLGPGHGRGDGGTGNEGFFRLVPPSPRGIIMPPSNRSLRGTQVQIWVFVNEQGRVVADSTRLDPPTRDRAFNRRLMDEAAEWTFNPAIQEGKPVAAWFPYTFSW